MDSVTILIVNWNGKRFLSKCLDGLKRQTYKDFSIILVDNASNDGSVSFVTENYPEVKILALSENLGFSVANNIVLKKAKSKYVVLLNNDAVAHPVWLKSLVKALETHAEAGFAASKMPSGV